MSHIACYSFSAYRSMFGALNKRLQISMKSRSHEQRAPDVQASHRIVDLSLGQQSLGIGDVSHSCQTIFVSFTRQHLSLLSRPQLVGSFLCYAQCAIKQRLGSGVLPSQSLHCLIEPRVFHSFIAGFDFPSRPDTENVEGWKG